MNFNDMETYPNECFMNCKDIFETAVRKRRMKISIIQT